MYFCRYNILNGISKAGFGRGFMSENRKISTAGLRACFFITGMRYYHSVQPQSTPVCSMLFLLKISVNACDNAAE